MSEDQRQHLEFIQNIITRMNSNSFSIKEWMIAINTAMLALFAGTEAVKPEFLLVAIAPTVIFWFLDTYYLYMERKYRSLYDKVVSNQSNVNLYDLDASKEPVCFFETLFRPVEAFIYVPIIVASAVAYILL